MLVISYFCFADPKRMVTCLVTVVNYRTN
uniref:Uncharacterized protein n=1 Tax=Arundo donax TaxID=35708 RepID=A0A0A9G6K5_ARUDO